MLDKFPESDQTHKEVLEGKTHVDLPPNDSWWHWRTNDEELPEDITFINSTYTSATVAKISIEEY